MPALPPDSTARLYIAYNANGHEHVASFRYAGSGAPDSTFLEGIDEILIALNPFMPSDWAFLGASYSVPGSNVRLGLTFTPTAFAGAQSPVPGAAPSYLSLVGRSASGKRWRSFILGQSFTPFLSGSTNGDYRVTTAEDANVSALVSAYITSDVIAIDGGVISYKPYINLGFNAHWQKAVRP